MSYFSKRYVRFCDTISKKNLTFFRYKYYSYPVLQFNIYINSSHFILFQVFFFFFEYVISFTKIVSFVGTYIHGL